MYERNKYKLQQQKNVENHSKLLRCFIDKYYWDDKIKEYETEGALTRMGEKQSAYKNFVRNT